VKNRTMTRKLERARVQARAAAASVTTSAFSRCTASARTPSWSPRWNMRCGVPKRSTDAADGIFHRIGDGSADGCDAALAGPFDAKGSDEISQPHLLAKFVSVPIYDVGRSQCGEEPMSAICDVDLATFCGRIGNLYMRHRLCPPFALRDAVQRWMAREIPLSHCVDVIEQFLSRHAGSCYSGSGDWNFACLDSLIQTSWHERSLARPPGPAPQQSRHDNRSENYGSEEPNQRSRRGADFTAAPKVASTHDSFWPDGIAVRQKAAGAFSPRRDTRSPFPQQGSQPPRNAPKSSGQEPAPSPKKIDVAVAWLRAELASGERSAVEVESNAVCAGIAPRTYDRARKRLGITSTRIGFGRCAKYMVALPVIDGTPSEGRTWLALHEKK
jgi:hypothetical protein